MKDINEPTIISLKEGEQYFEGFKNTCEQTHTFICETLTKNGLVDNTFNVINILQIMISQITGAITDKEVRAHISNGMSAIFDMIEVNLHKKEGA